MGEIHLDFTVGQLQDLRFPVGALVDDLFLSPGPAAIRTDLHSQAVELVGAAEVPAGTEGGDGHDVAVLQHGSITGGIAQGVALAVHGNAAGREKIESQPPLLEIAADGIIDIPGDPRVLIEQDISVIRDLLDPGIVGLPDAQRIPCHLGILPVIGFEQAFVPIRGVIVDDRLARVEAVDGMDDDVFRSRFLWFAGAQEGTGEAQGHNAAQGACFHRADPPLTVSAGISLWSEASIHWGHSSGRCRFYPRSRGRPSPGYGV